MKFMSHLACGVLLLTSPLFAQEKRLWVLRAPGEMAEYDPATFAAKQVVKVPAEAVQSPENVSVNRLGQILFETPVSLPLSEDDPKSAHKIWLWNGHSAATIDQGLKRDLTAAGSNHAIAESSPVAYLAADGAHLFWFANEARRLQREGVDLSTTTSWEAWQTDLSGVGRQDLATSKFPDCRCATGTCEDSCPYGMVWAPENGVANLFLMTQLIAGQTEALYKATTRYQQDAGKWTATPMSDPLQRILDASSDGTTIVEAIPDKGCCGWSNVSNDQTLVLVNGKTRTAFDEQATYKNPDYDVSFFTSIAKLSSEGGALAMTIVSTVQVNKAIQLTESGEANPEELLRIRKALADLPAVQVMSLQEPSGKVTLLPHAALVGWISEKEILIVEDHVLVAYNVGTGARRKSSVRVEDAGKVFLR
jgi:hypothetical protein